MNTFLENNNLSQRNYIISVICDYYGLISNSKITMLMNFRGYSKSTPKFFTKDTSSSQSKLYFKEAKAPTKDNIFSKKNLKYFSTKNKENYDVQFTLQKQQKQTVHSSNKLLTENTGLTDDDDLQRENRKKQMNQMTEKVNKIQNRTLQIKELLQRIGQKKKRHKINIQGKINCPRKETISSINSFVTQMKIPSQVTHSSSESNLLMVKQSIKPNSKHKYYVSTIINAFNSKANTTFFQICKSHLTTSLQLLKALKSTDKPEEVNSIRELTPTNKNTIIFDLDETLIHCNDNTSMPYDVMLDIKFPGGEIVKAGINVRAKAFQTLKILSKYFQIMVFTASHQCYGSAVCDYLDPNNQFISERYYRDSCFKSKQGYYIKDLRIIDRPIHKLLLVDNAAYSYAFQVQNGIPIIPFYDCKTDMQLKYLVQYLIPFSSSTDLRADHCSHMRVDQYPKFTYPIDLINELYGDTGK